MVHVDGLNDTVYLANYYGAKLFYNDTAIADAKARIFKGKPFEEVQVCRGGAWPKFFELRWMNPWNSTTAANFRATSK